MILTTEAYDTIQNLKALGLKQSQVAAKTGISRPTVKKYWDMPKDKLLQLQQTAEGEKQINLYKEEILSCLKKYPEMSAAQIASMICMRRNVKEDQLGVQPRTFQKYVGQLRKEYGIPKEPYTKATLDPSPNGSDSKSILVKLEEKKVQVSERKIIDFAAHKTHSKNNHEI